MDSRVSRPRNPQGRLHVVFLIRSFGFPKGTAATNRVLLLGRALVERDVAVRTLCIRVSDRPAQVLNHRVSGTLDGIRFLYTTGTTVRSNSFCMRRYRELRGYVIALAELARLRRNGELDCVCFSDNPSRWYPSVWLMRRLLAAMGVPIVVQLNELPCDIVRRPAALSRGLSHLDGVDGAIAISEWLSTWALHEAERIGRRVVIIEVPIVVDAYESPSADPRGRPSSDYVYSASHVYSDDRRFLLRAMTHVWRRRPDARLVVLGTDLDELALLARYEGLDAAVADGRVVAMGYVTRAELLARYRTAAALLVPLHDDDVSRARFPTKIGEYLASGRPVVTTRVGEIDRFLHDGETAFVAQTPDVEAFAAKMVEALEDPERAAHIGAAGRRVAEKHFHYDLHAERLRAFFQRLSER